jgi:hypothetical protein
MSSVLDTIWNRLQDISRNNKKAFIVRTLRGYYNSDLKSGCEMQKNATMYIKKEAVSVAYRIGGKVEELGIDI